MVSVFSFFFFKIKLTSKAKVYKQSEILWTETACGSQGQRRIVRIEQMNRSIKTGLLSGGKKLLEHTQAVFCLASKAQVGTGSKMLWERHNITGFRILLPFLYSSSAESTAGLGASVSPLLTSAGCSLSFSLSLLFTSVWTAHSTVLMFVSSSEENSVQNVGW